MSNIQKSKAELQIIDEILEYIFINNDLDFQIGDLFWSEHYGICELQNISLKEEYNDNLDYDKIHKSSYILLHWKYLKNENYKREIETVSDFLHYRSTHKIESQTAEQFYEDINSIADNKITLEELINQKFNVNSQTSSSNELMVMDKNILIQKKKELLRQHEFATARMNAVKNMLEHRMREMREVATQFKKYVSKLNRLIFSIELYLGLNEEMVQFNIGLNAPESDPICLRQRRLYMDVEMGDPTDDLKGLDFTGIEDFDEWLLKFNPYHLKKNYEILIPESKCIVIFKVRKTDKQYFSDNPWLNMIYNEENKFTYILIRNGENIFRIWADIIIDEKLFPDQIELEKLMHDLEGEKISDYDKEKAESKYERYKLNIILLQGIIERTNCFPDNKYNTNLFIPEQYLDKVKFIYDGTLSNQLPSGIPTFLEWKKQLNNQLEEGNRILYISKLYKAYKYKEDIQYRLFKSNYRSEWNVPDAPKDGIYTLFTELARIGKYSRDEKDILFIKYNPKDEVRISWGNYDSDNDYIRKNRLSYAIFKDDEFIINYDAINRDQLKTLDFYLYTRIGREDYLSYIPILMDLYKAKELEIKEENSFIELCLSQAGLDIVNDFHKGIEAMEWWKLKNKWKRGLNNDDTKALRMIIKKLKNNL